MILLNGNPITIKRFPNGEVLLEKNEIASNKKDEGNSVTLKYESDLDLFNLLLVRKALWFPCDLSITYMPYSRMDRQSDIYVFTLKSICKYINWLDFNRIYVFEPHSDVTPALLIKCGI